MKYFHWIIVFSFSVTIWSLSSSAQGYCSVSLLLHKAFVSSTLIDFVNIPVIKCQFSQIFFQAKKESKCFRITGFYISNCTCDLHQVVDNVAASFADVLPSLLQLVVNMALLLTEGGILCWMNRSMRCCQYCQITFILIAIAVFFWQTHNESETLKCKNKAP